MIKSSLAFLALLGTAFALPASSSSGVTFTERQEALEFIPRKRDEDSIVRRSDVEERLEGLEFILWKREGDELVRCEGN